MNKYFTIPLLFLCFIFFGCSPNAPSEDDIIEWISDNDEKSMDEFIAAYEQISTREKEYKAKEIIEWKEAYEYAFSQILNYDNPTFYKNFGVWFDSNPKEQDESKEYIDYHEILRNTSEFNSINSEVLKKNIKYLNPGWINRVVRGMNTDPHIYILFLDEFNRRRGLNNYRSESLLFVALWKQENKDVVSLWKGKDEVQDYILEYSSLLDKKKYQGVVDLCNKIKSLDKVNEKYMAAYREYKSCQMEYNNKREDLRSKLKSFPYGIPQDELYSVNRLKTDYDEADRAYSNSVKQVKEYEPQMKIYNQYRTEIENIIVKNVDIESLNKMFEMPL